MKGILKKYITNQLPRKIFSGIDDLKHSERPSYKLHICLAFRYLIRGAFSIYVCAFKILLFSVYYVYIRRK